MSLPTVCAPQLGVDPASVLGGEVYDRELLAAMARAGARVDLILPQGRPCDGEVPWRVHRIRVPGGPRAIRRMGKAVAFTHAIQRLHRVAGFRVLRIHSASGMGPSAIAARGLGRWKVGVLSQHYHLEGSPLELAITGAVLRRSDAVSVTSAHARDEAVRRFRLDPERVQVVYPGVGPLYHPADGAGASAARQRLGLDQDAFVILSLGRLEGRKRPLEVVEAVAALRAQRKDAVLLMVGQGPLEGAARVLAARLGIADWVRWLPPVPESAKPDLYHACDAFTSASRLEGFGLTLAEAMACGRPVVAPAAASIPEVVRDGRTGILASEPGPRGLAEGLAALAIDDALRRRLGKEAARDMATRFRWDEAARRTLAVCEEIAPS